MRKIAAYSLLVCLLFASVSFAAVTGAEAPKGEEHLLITNAGQGPGGKMGRLLVARAEVVEQLTYNAEPKPEDIAAGGYKTILVVIGSSAKGLGASGITIDQEVDRLHAIMEKAKELIAQIESMKASEPLYDAKVKVLGEYIDHHVKEEQDELFPKARKAKLDMEKLGAELKARKDALLPETADAA